MSKLLLAAGAAALAFSATAMAHDHNKQRGKGPDKAMKADKGPKHARGNGQGRGKPDRAMQMARDNGPPAHARGGNKVEKAITKAARGNDRGIDARMADGRDFIADEPFFYNGRARISCPPGLDKKNNGCLPPGQAKKLMGSPLRSAFANERIPYAYRNWYRDNDDFFFRSGDGFIYRVNRGSGLVDGLIPLFGSGYYSVGDPWPEPYDFYNIPYQYRTYWADGGDYRYRYGDGAIYRLDAKTAAVQSIVALLAGDLGVGSRMPTSYTVYNVPMAFRDRYYDTANDWYRYNDGYIYRVDPTTQLITAVIDAII